LQLSLGGRKWLRLLVAAVGLYMVLLPLWWVSLGWLASLASATAGLIYHTLNPLVSISSDQTIINVTVRASEASGFAGQSHTSPLRVDTITYGLPMLAALVMVTRADSIKVKCRALALGMGVMLALTVPAVIIWTKLTILQLDDMIARANYLFTGDRASFFYYAFHGYAFSQPILAVALWIGLVVLGLFREKPAPEPKVKVKSKKLKGKRKKEKENSER
jgi:hypothetical protein